MCLVTELIRGSEMSVSHENMTSLENMRHSALLRQASGYIELAEFNMTPNGEVSEPSKRLLCKAIELLDRLSATEKLNGNATVLRAEALRVLGRFLMRFHIFDLLLPKPPSL